MCLQVCLSLFPPYSLPAPCHTPLASTYSHLHLRPCTFRPAPSLLHLPYPTSPFSEPVHSLCTWWLSLPPRALSWCRTPTSPTYTRRPQRLLGAVDELGPYGAYTSRPLLPHPLHSPSRPLLLTPPDHHKHLVSSQPPSLSPFIRRCPDEGSAPLLLHVAAPLLRWTAHLGPIYISNAVAQTAKSEGRSQRPIPPPFPSNPFAPTALLFHSLRVSACAAAPPARTCSTNSIPSALACLASPRRRLLIDLHGAPAPPPCPGRSTPSPVASNEESDLMRVE